MPTFMAIYRVYGQILAAFATFAGLCAFLLMWLVDANVIGRKVFNVPLMGSVEIAQALLVYCILLGIPFAQAQGSHLRVTILVGRLPRRVQMALHVFAMLAGAAVFALMAYSSSFFALRSWQVGEEVWGAAFRFPLYPVKAALPVGAALVSLQFVLDAIRVGVFGQSLPHDEISGLRDLSSA